MGKGAVYFDRTVKISHNLMSRLEDTKNLGKEKYIEFIIKGRLSNILVFDVFVRLLNLLKTGPNDISFYLF